MLKMYNKLFCKQRHWLEAKSQRRGNTRCCKKMLCVTWNNDEGIFLYVYLLLQLKNIEKPSIAILSSVTSDIKNYPMIALNQLRKIQRI